MAGRMIAVLCVVALVGATNPAVAGDCGGCSKIAKGADGFCCAKGKAFGVEIASKKLFTALSGHEFDAEKLQCPGCKTAAQCGGRCETCNISAANGKFYRSPVAHVLAKGMPTSAGLVAACPERCKQCPIAHKNSERCKSCDVGFVADRMFQGTDLYEGALAAFATLKKAVHVAGACEQCAVALVTDGTCTKCNVKFTGGERATDKG